MPIQYVVLIISGVVMGIAIIARCYLICCFNPDNNNNNNNNDNNNNNKQ